MRMLLTSLLLLAWFQTACGRGPSFVEKEVDATNGNGADDGLSETDAEAEARRKLKQGSILKTNEPSSSEHDDGQFSINFTQNQAGRADILWVIDNSGSMQASQKGLRNNIQFFIESLVKTSLDYHIGITSTDVCHDTLPERLEERRCPQKSQPTREARRAASKHHRGSLVGPANDKIISANDADPVEKFRRYAKLGTKGSSFEHGLTATKLAIEKAAQGQNGNFLRSDAFLAVIIVSDEEDDGVGLSRANEDGFNYHEAGLSKYRYDATDLLADLTKHKGQNFSVTSIVGTKSHDGSLCKSPYAKAIEEGAEYQKLSQQTGGSLQSICDYDWSQKLTKIAQDLNAQIESVSLKAVPEAATIVVTVNGQTFQEWDYIEARNTIQFRTGHVPPPGSRVKITFERAE